MILMITILWPLALSWVALSNTDVDDDGEDDGDEDNVMMMMMMIMTMSRPVASSWVSPANYSPPNLLRRVKHTLT